LTQLVRRRLLRIERSGGAEPRQRRTTSFYTTDRFLKLFGLETIDDLPQSEELDGH
jgi:segregation and condensation protein B